MNSAESHKNTANYLPMLYGVLAGFVTAFFISELFQGLIALILGAGEISFGFSDYNFHSFYKLGSDSGWVYPLVISISSISFVIAALRFSTMMLIRSKLGPNRFFAIFFQLVLAGYLLISVFYGTFVVTLKAPIESDWLKIVDVIGLEDFYRAGFMFAMIALTALYLQILSRRIKIYIGEHNN